MQKLIYFPKTAVIYQLSWFSSKLIIITRGDVEVKFFEIISIELVQQVS